MTEERRRIRDVYRDRARDEKLAARYRVGDAAARLAIEDRTPIGLDLVASAAIDITHARVLDVGCGAGGELARLVARGADPRRLVGVDLLPFRLVPAPEAVPGASFAAADGSALPFRDGSFDLVLLYTVLSSILDLPMHEGVAREISRILRPGGALLWYDFKWNPMNRQTRGVGPRHVRSLFPDFRHETRSVTLAPPIARAVAPRSMRAAATLQRIPFLRSHTVGIAVKPQEPRA